MNLSATNSSGERKSIETHLANSVCYAILLKLNASHSPAISSLACRAECAIVINSMGQCLHRVNTNYMINIIIRDINGFSVCILDLSQSLLRRQRIR